jgi:hypothetical protein
MKHVVSFSTGLSSALTVERVLNRYGKEATSVVFMDTQFEDDDNYRFMNECKKRWDVPIIVLCEGRTPYEVSRSENVIPNSFIAPCTFRLKINIFKAWLETQEKPITIHIGYDFSEIHRCDKTKKNYEELGYSVDFPLLWEPIEEREYTDVSKNDWGIEPPRMYPMGYTHANCGGRCVKQGQGDWIRTLINFPDRYKEIEDWEQEMRTHSERHAVRSILKRSVNKETVPFTLRELREKYESEHLLPKSKEEQLYLFTLDSKSMCVVCGIGDILSEEVSSES